MTFPGQGDSIPSSSTKNSQYSSQYEGGGQILSELPSHSSWARGNINHTHSSIGSSRNGSSRIGTSYKKSGTEFD